MTADNAASYDDLVAALPRVRRYAWVLTGDPGWADQLVQHALRRMREMHASGWRHAAPRLSLFDCLRKVYLASISPDARPARSSATIARATRGDSTGILTASPPGDRLARNEVVLRLMELPVDQREVLLLVAVEGLHYDDISALLDVPIATVLARLNGARENLKGAG